MMTNKVRSLALALVVGTATFGIIGYNIDSYALNQEAAQTEQTQAALNGDYDFSDQWVIDNANVIDDTTQEQLDDYASKWNAAYDSSFYFVTMNSSEDGDMEQYYNDEIVNLGIGSTDMLVVYDADDHTMHFDSGYDMQSMFEDENQMYNFAAQYLDCDNIENGIADYYQAWDDWYTTNYYLDSDIYVALYVMALMAGVAVGTLTYLLARIIGCARQIEEDDGKNEQEYIPAEDTPEDAPEKENTNQERFEYMLSLLSEDPALKPILEKIRSQRLRFEHKYELAVTKAEELNVYDYKTRQTFEEAKELFYSGVDEIAGVAERFDSDEYFEFKTGSLHFKTAQQKEEKKKYFIGLIKQAEDVITRNESILSVMDRAVNALYAIGDNGGWETESRLALDNLKELAAKKEQQAAIDEQVNTSAYNLLTGTGRSGIISSV